MLLLFLLLDAVFIAFPIYYIPRVEPLNAASIPMIAIACLAYYWLIACLSIFMLAGKITLTKGDLAIRVPETKNFFLIKMRKVRIPLTDIVNIAIGDKKYIKSQLRDQTNIEKLSEFYEGLKTRSFYYTRGADDVGSTIVLALLSNDGQLTFVSIKSYSQKALDSLAKGLKEYGISIAIKEAAQ